MVWVVFPVVRFFIVNGRNLEFDGKRIFTNIFFHDDSIPGVLGRAERHTSSSHHASQYEVRYTGMPVPNWCHFLCCGQCCGSGMIFFRSDPGSGSDFSESSGSDPGSGSYSGSGSCMNTYTHTNIYTHTQIYTHRHTSIQYLNQTHIHIHTHIHTTVHM